MYPHGCDVVDKLRGWCHFVQFTLAVVNKVPKKSKCSDSLHRFSEKRREWGWKKFMELISLLDTDETPDPIVLIDKNMFVLADDVLLLLQRAALEPLPPKDEKGLQNRTMDRNSGEDFNNIECDERRLRSVEIFVLAHIFSKKIEVEAVAYKKQDELIREEELTCQVDTEQKARRGASEKEKQANKKQSKQKRSSSRKIEDEGRDERFDFEVQKRNMFDLSLKQVLNMFEKLEALDDVSDVSFTGDDNIETLRPDIEDRDAKRPKSVMDDS